MQDIPRDQRGINLKAWLAGVFGLALLGFAFLRRGLQKLACECKADQLAAEENVACLEPR
jgi:hypothetical protein